MALTSEFPSLAITNFSEDFGHSNREYMLLVLVSNIAATLPVLKLIANTIAEDTTMCTALFAFGVHPRLLFFLAFNRDEFLDRHAPLSHKQRSFARLTCSSSLEVRGSRMCGIRFSAFTNVDVLQA